MEKILEIKGLKKQGILNGIDFTIQQGDMAAIMGPSGSGKSTFLYQISGMDQADGGEIWYRDMELGHMTERERAAFRLRESGFVFQQMNMLKGLTIKENILLPAYHLYKGKKERKEANERAESLMKKLGIETLSERRISEVSGGQLQRACICGRICYLLDGQIRGEYSVKEEREAGKREEQVKDWLSEMGW